jgi:hypothetical protein
VTGEQDASAAALPDYIIVIAQLLQLGSYALRSRYSH